MKLTKSWLSDFIDLSDLTPTELVEAFESLGHEIEDWHLIEQSFTGVIIGKVLEVAPHPNADKVRLTKVDVGNEVLDIICGAWNFEAGAVVPVAVPGAVLGGEFEITRRAIRGVTSNGMICSETELDLGDDADGIMVLNDDYPAAMEAIGNPFESLLDMPDIYLEVNVTPDRPDCLSVYGLARDLAALFEIPLREHGIAVDESGDPSEIAVEIEVPEMNPRFAGREVRGITVGPSPHWMRWRLGQAGMRPISNVVDASNYAMIEFGHPTHAFDIERLGTKIVTRMAEPGETIVTLDEQERTLDSRDIVVTDGDEAVAIGGVMGGASTEVHADTKDVFIEAAYWNPPSVLMTSKRLALRSEASARFERGADPMFCALGADRVAQLLTATAGGRPAPRSIDVDPGGITPWEIAYPLSATERTLGIPLDRDTTACLLQRLTFGVEGHDPLIVTVPTRRPDVRRSIDLVEEIARLHGFDSIPDTVPRGPGGGLPFRERRLRAIRELMVGAGFYEALTFAFVGHDDLDRLGYGDGHAVRNGIAVVNPLNDEEGVMRTTLLPGVLKSAARNASQRIANPRLFEIGKVFLEGTGKLPEQPDRMAFVIAGKPASSWLGAGSEPDYYDGAGVWDMLADQLGISSASLRKASLPSFHPGRCAEILIGDVVIGAVGELHPSVADAFGLTGRVVVAEFDLDELLIDRGNWEYEPPSFYPPILFDLAFEVDSSTPASDVMDAAASAAGEYLEDLRVFDVFEGDSVGEGQKSLALAFRFRAPDRTLTDDQAAPIRRAIAEAVEARTGGSLRGAV